MASNEDTSREVTPIQVRTRNVFSGDGEYNCERSVYCPAREASVATSACHVCGYSQGFRMVRQQELMLCDHDTAHDAVRQDATHVNRVQRDRTPVRDLMTTEVLCVRPDVSLEALRSMLLEREISAVPVVDERGAPVGIVSKTDLVQREHDQGETDVVESTLDAGFHTSTLVKATVADVMTPVPITFPEDVLIAQVAAVMAHEGVHTLPVVGFDGKVVGIVSSLDIARWYAQREGYVLAAKHRR